MPGYLPNKPRSEAGGRKGKRAGLTARLRLTAEVEGDRNWISRNDVVLSILLAGLAELTARMKDQSSRFEVQCNTLRSG